MTFSFRPSAALLLPLPGQVLEAPRAEDTTITIGAQTPPAARLIAQLALTLIDSSLIKCIQIHDRPATSSAMPETLIL